MSVTILQGGALTVLRTLPSESVQCVVTSPPYYGLRAYGTAPQVWGGDPEHGHTFGQDLPGRKTIPRPDHSNGVMLGTRGVNGGTAARGLDTTSGAICPCGAWRGELGSEPTPALFIEHLVTIFDEIKRVLRPDGVCFVNLAPSYAGSGKGPTGHNGIGNQAKRQGFVGASGGSDASRTLSPARAPAYGSDGIGQSGSPDPDFAYSGLCDGCLADFLSHHARSAGMLRPQQHDEPHPSLTDRDSALADSERATPGASALGVQASTTLESWRQLRGECSRCASRAASFVRAGLLTDGHAAQGFAHTTASPSAARSTSVAMRGQNGSNGGNGETGDSSADRTQDMGGDSLSYLYSSIAAHQWKSKDLIPIPEMFALAMRFRGWWVRSEIVWAKKSSMPESVRDRPTSAWEPIFMFTKSARYFWDADAVAQPSKSTAPSGNGYVRPERLSVDGVHQGQDKPWQVQPTSALRNVWLLGPEPSRLSHWASFPTEIPRRCIKAASRPGDTILDPFLGSGTTALVADQLGRHAIGIELSPTYAEMARKRIESDAPMVQEPVTVEAPIQTTLFEEAAG